jgi:hypothetical protein
MIRIVSQTLRGLAQGEVSIPCISGQWKIDGT